MNPRNLPTNPACSHVLRLLVCIGVCSAFLAGAGVLYGADAPQKPDLAALVNQMPDADPGSKDGSGKYTGPDPAAAEKVYQEILKGGKDSVVGLVAMVVEPGVGGDYKVRYLLHGLVTYVARADADKDRQTVCEALASTLGGTAHKAVKGFVMQELQAIADKAAVGTISKFLLDEELYDPAAGALLSIGGTADVFRKALPEAKGRNRVAIVQALGVLRDAQAVADLKKAATDADSSIRVAALDSLGNIGDATAVDILLSAGDAAKERWERVRAAEDCLLLAKRLLEADNKKDAERIYRGLWEKRSGSEDRHVRIAALQGLLGLRPEMSDLLAAMKTGDPQIIAVTIRSAASATGEDMTAKCIGALERAAAPDRAGLLAILGARGDAAAASAVLKAMKDPDEQVRAAAMQAAAAIGGQQPAEALVDAAINGQGKDREAAAGALAKARGKETNAVVAAAMKKASKSEVKSSLLGVLAARRAGDQADAVMEAAADKEASVRLAALKALGMLAGDSQLSAIVKILRETKDKDELAAAEEALRGACSRRMNDAVAKAVAPALANAPADNVAAMIRVLGAAGTGAAMDAVVACVTSSRADIKDVAIHVLKDWPRKEAIGPLLQIAQAADNQTHKVLALRGVLRLASDKSMKPDEKIKVLGEAMKAVKRPEEKREVLAVLGTVHTLQALRMAAECLDDDAVKDEAAAAVIQIAPSVAKDNPDAVREAANKILKTTKDERLRSGAQRILGQAGKP